MVALEQNTSTAILATGNDDADGRINGGSGTDGGSMQRAQSFTLGQASAVSYCKLRCSKQGTPTDNMYLELRTTLGGATLATSNEIDISGFPLWPSQTEGESISIPLVEFIFPTTDLGIGQHFIVMRRTGAFDATNAPGVRTWLASLKPYSGGESWVLNRTGWEEDGSGVDEHEIEFELGGVGTLYIENTGFRFPYQKWT